MLTPRNRALFKGSVAIAVVLAGLAVGRKIGNVAGGPSREPLDRDAMTTLAAELKELGLERSRGSAGAAHRLVEIVDYSCVVCREVNPRLEERIVAGVGEGWLLHERFVVAPATDRNAAFMASLDICIYRALGPARYWESIEQVVRSIASPKGDSHSLEFDAEEPGENAVSREELYACVAGADSEQLADDSAAAQRGYELLVSAGASHLPLYALDGKVKKGAGLALVRLLSGLPEELEP